MPGTEAVVLVGSADRARVLTVLGEFGLRAVVAAGPGELAGASAGLALIDPSLLGAVCVDGLRSLQERLERTPIVFMTGTRTRESLALLIGFPDMVAIIPREGPNRDVELRAAVRGVVDGPRDGLDGVVGGHADQLRITITGSESRDTAVEALTDFFDRSGVRSRKARVLVAAAEELITNAVYDAPVNLEGAAMYAQLDRRQPVELHATHYSEVLAATDNESAVVIVRDPFGALRARTVRRFLSKGLRGGVDQIDSKLGGAGLGLTRIYEMADRFIVRIWPGKRTEQVVVVHMRGGGSAPTSLRIVRSAIDPRR